MIRLLLADDQALVREGLVALLGLQPDLQVVVSACDGQGAVDAVRQLGCGALDVALLDVRMPRLTGVQAVREIKRLCPDLPVMMLTTFSDSRYVRESLEAGAAAYLLKDVPSDDLATAIRLLAAGDRLIPADLARRWAAGGLGLDADTASERASGERLPAGERSPTDSGGGDEGSVAQPLTDETLTPRQQEVLELIGQGLSNGEIAQRLFLSEGTVKNYVSEIYARLNLRNRVELAMAARRQRGEGSRGGTGE